MREALLTAVLADPDDDDARLVYADALQTAGDPRGELIAVQCELARLGCGPHERLFLEWVGDALAHGDPALIAKLRKRESSLLAEHPAGATDDLPPVAHVGVWRGFADRVVWALGSKAGFEAIVKRAPITSVMPTSAKDAGALKAFLALPALAHVREIYNASVLEHGLAPFATSALPGLRRLLLSHTGGPHDLEMLPQASYLSRLTGLVLNGFALLEHDLGPLLARTTALEELQLVDTRIGDANAAKLATMPTFGKLRVLAIRHGRLTTAGPFLEHAEHLRALDLRSNKLGAADTKMLGAGFPSLRVLDLGNNPLSAEAVAQLASGKGLESLHVLGLQHSGIDDAMVRAIAGSRWVKQLSSLDLRKNAITDAGAKALAKVKDLSSLRTLFLGGNRLTPAGKKQLKAALTGARLYL